MSFFMFFPPNYFLRAAPAGFSSAGFGRMKLPFIVHDVLETYKQVFPFFCVQNRLLAALRRTARKKPFEFDIFLREKDETEKKRGGSSRRFGWFHEKSRRCGRLPNGQFLSILPKNRKIN